MSVRTIRYLHCDGEDCPLAGEAYHCAPAVDAPAQEEREHAKRNGWLINQPGGKDYCPDCWEKLK